jgi:alkylation response protein AidB-like acyl-CoA dehydrogenase
MEFEPRPEEREVQARARLFAFEFLVGSAASSDERLYFDKTMPARLGEAGLIGGPLPRAFGGEEWTKVSWALAMEELGAVDSSWRGFCTVQTALCGLLLVEFGTPEQQRLHLGALARGEGIYAFAMTEPYAGTDFAECRTIATPDGDGWTISGEKVWITNGGIADHLFVFASVDREQPKRGYTCFLVRGDAPGLKREHMPGRPLGHRASDHAHLVFDRVRVERADVVGGVGAGAKVGHGALEQGRLGVAAGAVGIHRACFEICLDFARRRRQFGKRVGDFQLLQGVLANMYCELEASRLLVLKAARLRDQGRPNAREVSVAKYAAVEKAAEAANQAVVFLGSRGYADTSPVERHLRDVKGMQIYEGTSHVQQVIIARDLLGKDGGETL